MSRIKIDGEFNVKTGDITIEDIDRLSDLFQPFNNKDNIALISDHEKFNEQIINDEFRRVHRVWIHENAHWYQQIGTPYGIYAMNVKSLPFVKYKVITQLSDIMNKTLQIKKPLNLWLYSYYEQSSQNKIKKDGLLDYMVEGYHSINAEDITLSYLDGNIIGSSADAAWRKGLSHFIEDKGIKRDFWIPISKKKKLKNIPSSPMIMNGIYLGGLLLIEGHSLAQEELAIVEHRILSGKDDIKIFDEEKWSTGYEIPFDYFLATKNISRSDKLTNIRWLGLLYEFISCCDLAFCTPIDIMFKDMWHKEMSWEDFHPGWRFIKILNFLSKKKLEWNEFDNLNNYYRRFYDTICSDFYWPKPHEFTISEEDAPSVYGMLSKKALRFRADYPAIYIGVGLGLSQSVDVWIDLYKKCPQSGLSEFKDKDTETWATTGYGCPDWFPKWLKKHFPSDSDMEFFKKYNNNLLYRTFIYGGASLYDLSYQLYFKKGPFTFLSNLPINIDATKQLFHLETGTHIDEIEYFE